MILPLVATSLNYFNLVRGITKENEHWFVNRFRSFFAVLQIFHLPFTYNWASGAFLYWISSSTFVLLQSYLTRHPWFLQRINPQFFTNCQKLYGMKSVKEHENYIERLLNNEDQKLKHYTNNKQVLIELEEEMKRFLVYQ